MQETKKKNSRHREKKRCKQEVFGIDSNGLVGWLVELTGVEWTKTHT